MIPCPRRSSRTVATLFAAVCVLVAAPIALSQQGPFPVTHRDGLRAQEVADAGNRSMRTAAEGVEVALTL